MANSLSNFAPKILAKGLMALRGFNIMPRIVNNSYGNDAKEKGETVVIPVPASRSASAVTPAATPPSTTDVTDSNVTINLDEWYEASFNLSDKDLLKVEKDASFMPAQVSEAVKALANNVNSAIFSAYKGVYGYAGTAGTTPFATTIAAATSARQVLNAQLAALGDRRVVLDGAAAANALGLQQFTNAQWRGQGSEPLREGELGRLLGFDWYEDQQVPTHTKGTLAAGTTIKVNGAVTAGAATFNIDATSLTGTLLPGDVFTVDGDTQTYVVTNSSTLTASSNAIAGITFAPVAQANWSDNAEVTLKASHVANLAFHRDAFAFASRPLVTSEHQHPAVITRSATDPVSGISLRLEITREYKRTRWAFDILYGYKLVRPELACRIAG